MAVATCNLYLQVHTPDTLYLPRGNAHMCIQVMTVPGNAAPKLTQHEATFAAPAAAPLSPRPATQQHSHPNIPLSRDCLSPALRQQGLTVSPTLH